MHRRALGEVALTLAAVMGLAVGGLTLTASRSGMRPLVVRSGSMAPAIPAGSMVLVQRVPATDVDTGDVVAVTRPDGSRVMHRVVAVDHDGATATLTLKGDANEDPDTGTVPVRFAHRLVWHSPALGQALAWLATTPGAFLLGCAVTALVLGLGRRTAPPTRSPGRSRRAGAVPTHAA